MQLISFICFEKQTERKRERIWQTERKQDRLAKNRVRKPNRTVSPSWRYELIPYRTRYGQFLGHTITVAVIEPKDAVPHIPTYKDFRCQILDLEITQEISSIIIVILSFADIFTDESP